MFSSMTLQVSPRIATMACSCVNAILLFTSLFSSTIYAAPTSVPTHSQRHSQFWDLLHHSETLYNIHHSIYNQYRLQRLQSTDLVLTDMSINGFPNFRSLSTRDRIDIGTDDLTITDRAFLNLLLTTMRHVEQDETLYPGAQSNGFLQDFHDIVELLETLTAQIDGWIELNELEGANHLTIGEIAWPDDLQEFERTLHALYVLQEMDSFLPHFRADFTRLFYFQSQDDGQQKKR